MKYAEDDYLQLSGLQHFAFCKRQWALMTVEDLWADNWRTTSGALMHERVHDGALKEKRGDTITLRALRVVSHELGLSGECDAVEFLRDENGVSLHGYAGKYRPFPVEYKRGRDKTTDADRLQLCAQAICLEEMLLCPVPEGALFYGETRRRTEVALTLELREKVKEAAAEMHKTLRAGVTPGAVFGKHCASCSLADGCLPEIRGKKSAKEYIEGHLDA